MTIRNGQQAQAYYAEAATFYQLRGPTQPFKRGMWYTRFDGRRVRCIKVNSLSGYETAQFLDFSNTRDPQLGYRYNRDQDRGRPTGTDYNDSLAIIPMRAPITDSDGFCVNRGCNPGQCRCDWGPADVLPLEITHRK